MLDSFRVMKKATARFWIVLGLATFLIHAVFCVQAFLPLQRGGMASDGPWLWIFYPHYMLMFFLPPAYPITYAGGEVQVSYLDFLGKMLVALPASVFYALPAVGIGTFFLRLSNR